MYSINWIVVWKNTMRSKLLSGAASQNIDEFADFFALVVFVTASDRVLNAMADVFAQDFFFGPSQCCAHRRNLSDDINAISIIFDHARQPTDLTFNAVEALLNGGFCIFLHD